MGTNYYITTGRKIKCCECPNCNGTKDEILHVGKSSGGWCFALRVYPELGINTLKDWDILLKNGQIKDEYGKDVSYTKMISEITERSFHKRDLSQYHYGVYPQNISWQNFLNKNHAIEGPNNLLRAKISEYCIGHGEGTWDYFVGDFS